MLLATYLPAVPTKSGKHKEYTKILGYSPIFCIPLNNPADAFAKSRFLPADENRMAERFVIFETDKYDTVDIIRMMTERKTPGIFKTKDIVNAPTDEKYHLYTTDTAEHFMEDFLLQDIIDGSVELVGEDFEAPDDVTESFSQIFYAQCRRMSEETRIAAAHFRTDIKKAEKERLCNEARKYFFENTMLTLLLTLTVPFDKYNKPTDVDIYLPNPKEIHENERKCFQMLDDFCYPKADPASTSYEKYDEIYETLSKMTLKLLSETDKLIEMTKEMEEEKTKDVKTE